MFFSCSPSWNEMFGSTIPDKYLNHEKAVFHFKSTAEGLKRITGVEHPGLYRALAKSLRALGETEEASHYASKASRLETVM